MDSRFNANSVYIYIYILYLHNFRTEIEFYITYEQHRIFRISRNMNLSQIYIHVYKCRRVLLPFLHFFLFPSLFFFLFPFFLVKLEKEKTRNVRKRWKSSIICIKRRVRWRFIFAWDQSRIIHVDNKALRYVFYTGRVGGLFFSPSQRI